MAADADAWNARPSQRYRALREGSSSLVEPFRSEMKGLVKELGRVRMHEAKGAEASGTKRRPCLSQICP